MYQKITGPFKFTGWKTLSCSFCNFFAKDIKRWECRGVVLHIYRKIMQKNLFAE